MLTLLALGLASTVHYVPISLAELLKLDPTIVVAKAEGAEFRVERVIKDPSHKLKGGELIKVAELVHDTSLYVDPDGMTESPLIFTYEQSTADPPKELLFLSPSGDQWSWALERSWDALSIAPEVELLLNP